MRLRTSHMSHTHTSWMVCPCLLQSTGCNQLCSQVLAEGMLQLLGPLLAQLSYHHQARIHGLYKTRGGGLGEVSAYIHGCSCHLPTAVQPLQCMQAQGRDRGQLMWLLGSLGSQQHWGVHASALLHPHLTCTNVATEAAAATPSSQACSTCSSKQQRAQQQGVLAVP